MSWWECNCVYVTVEHVFSAYNTQQSTAVACLQATQRVWNDL
jgi:hypothetical protein